MSKIVLPKFPPRDLEDNLIALGKMVAGIDEVGRGSWAGPLVMAAVIPGDGIIEGVRDSKKVSQKNRERLYDEILDWCAGFSIGSVSNTEIDQMGMSKALNICAHRTLDGLKTKIDVALLDGNVDYIKHQKIKSHLIIKGDNFSHVIAAASIVAKVHRDRYMASEDVAGKYPHFCFEKNKGYPAPVHVEALKEYGATNLHRISWDIFGENREDFKKMQENALI